MKGRFDTHMEMAGSASGIHIAIVTALPVECTAIRMIIDRLHDHPVPGDPNHYRSGWLPSKDPNRPHRVVVALQARDGTRNAASLCTDIARSFPQARTFVMCGIAGGVPSPRGTVQQVRLGDLVVATGGIVDYDHVRTVNGADTLRQAVTGLSATLLRADRELEMMALAGDEPWRTTLREAEAKAGSFRRPPDDADPLGRVAWSAGDTGLTENPPARRPRVHRGVIGSADRLLRDTRHRDALASRYGISAVEMEGSGIAVGADLHERGWFVVRGIADYCDNDTKSDVWHPYASLVAAVYVRALLAECHPAPTAVQRTAPASHGVGAIVDGLLSLQPMRDDYQRRAILAVLPDHIRTAVPDSVTGRLHVVGLVQTCQSFPDGQNALVDALRLSLGTASPDFHRIESIIQANWSDG